MILVDTSIWIEFFKNNSKVNISKEMIPSIVTCPPVIQEVLQGIRDETIYKRVYRSMTSFKLAGASITTEDYVEASSIYRSARRRGITNRSSVDCLIAAIAIKAQAQVWHNDRDFSEIAKFTDLKIFTVAIKQVTVFE